jgi:hypothetical protein
MACWTTYLEAKIIGHRRRADGIDAVAALLPTVSSCHRRRSCKAKRLHGGEEGEDDACRCSRHWWLLLCDVYSDL